MTDTPTFDSLGLSADTVAILHAAGYQQPTAIQAQAIPFVLEGQDVLGCAQTGTGKTASYALPMVEKLRKGRAKARMPRALVLAPTREIAMQVAEAFGQFGGSLNTVLLIGGTSPVEQERQMQRGADVVVATPGRLLDHVEKGKLMLMDIQMVVIDEADRMLDMGFIPDIERIMNMLPPRRQTLMFSATMPADIRKLADRFLRDPKEITITPKAMTAATVTQYLCQAPAMFKDKRDYLLALLKSQNIEKAIIFCNRKRDVALLAKSMSRHGLAVGELHGDMTQPERLRTLDRFKGDEFRFLAASDVAARGIHIEALPVVINFDVPHHAEDYVHRIGRTGRAGQEGCAYTLHSPDQEKFLQAIVKFCKPAFVPFQTSLSAAAPAETAAAAPAQAEASSLKTFPRSANGARRSRSEPRSETPAETGRQRHPAQGRERGARQDTPPAPFKGLGEDIPAFLRIPLPNF